MDRVARSRGKKLTTAAHQPRDNWQKKKRQEAVVASDDEALSDAIIPEATRPAIIREPVDALYGFVEHGI